MNNIMDLVRLRRFVRAQRVVRYVGIAALFATSGCVAASPSGFRLTASLGAEQVQEHTESYKVVDKTPCGGLKAWVVGCGEVASGS